MFEWTYICDFDNKKCRYNAIIDNKAYNTNQDGGVEV